MEVVHILNKFREFLALTWPLIEEMEKDAPYSGFSDNFLQANWEMIVESSIPPLNNKAVLLDFYASGAEGFAPKELKGFELFDKVTRSWIEPTHAVMAKPKNKSSSLPCLYSKKEVPFPKRGLVFSEFGSIQNSYFKQAPPFDCVCLEHDIDDESFTRRYIFKFSDLEFCIINMTDDLIRN